MELLLAHGADPNLQNQAGWTALMYACDQFDSDMDPSIPVLLLSTGANPNAARFDGLTALMVAANCGYHAGVEVLLRANADINVQDTFFGATALHFAARNGLLSVSEVLLAAGSDTSLFDEDGQTALDLALAGSHHDVCQLLLMHTSDVPETEHLLQLRHQEHHSLTSWYIQEN